MKECPQEKCFHWIIPGGAADMSGKTYQTLLDSFKNGDWQEFPYGECSCTWGKCNRLHDDGIDDYFEPGL
jgi:hypothetical protein